MKIFVKLECGRIVRTFCREKAGIVKGFLVFSAALNTVMFETLEDYQNEYTINVLGGVMCTAEFCDASPLRPVPFSRNKGWRKGCPVGQKYAKRK
jgi:hypothetical protein